MCALQFINDMSRGEGSWWNSNILSDLFPVKGPARGDELSSRNREKKKERRPDCWSLQRVCCNDKREGKKRRWRMTSDTQKTQRGYCSLWAGSWEQSKACFHLFHCAMKKQRWELFIWKLFVKLTIRPVIRIILTFCVFFHTYYWLVDVCTSQWSFLLIWVLLCWHACLFTKGSSTF